MLTSGIRPPSPVPRGKTFLPFDSTFITEGETPEKVLAEQPNRHPERYGMLRAITPSWGLWGPDGKPDEGLCRQLARQYAMWGVQLIALDVEMEWTKAPDPTTLQPLSAEQRVDFHNFAQRWVSKLKAMKAEVPGVMFALFGGPPFGGFKLNDPPAVRAERIARNQLAIDEGLVEVCDVFCPVAYIDHPVPDNPALTWDVRQKNWEDDVAAAGEECGTMYKRFIPYLCAHPNNAAAQGVADLMPAEIWVRQQQTVREIAHGEVLWGFAPPLLSSPAHMKAITDVLLPPG